MISSRRRLLLGSAAALLAGCWSRRPGSVGSRRLFTLSDDESFRAWPYDAALSHDGHRYAVIGPGPRIQVCAIEPWRELVSIELDATAINVASLDRDGSRIACSGWRPGGRLPPSVEIWSTTSGERLATLPAPGREVVALEFSADNSLLLVVSRGGHVRVWDTQQWRRVTALRAPADVLMASAISEDGDWIVTAERAEDRRHSHVNSWRRFDRRWTRIAENLPGDVRGLTIVGDRLGVAMDARHTPGAPGSHVWTGAGGLQPLNISVAGPTRPHSGPSLDALAFAADGHTALVVGGIACSGWGWENHAWVSIDEGPPRELPWAPHWPRAAAVRADGCLVAVGGGVTVWGPDLQARIVLQMSGEPVDKDGVLLCA